MIAIRGTVIGKQVILCTAAAFLFVAGPSTPWAAPPTHAKNDKPRDRNKGRWAEPSNSAPTISGAPDTEVLQDGYYQFRPTATDADGDTLTFSVTNPPTWASFNTTNGELSGTPGAGDVGQHGGIVVSVSDGQESASVGPFAITVVALAGNAPPAISGTPPSSVLQDTLYKFIPNANDPDGDALTFSITNQPSWSSLDRASGQLSGIPTAGDVGTYDGIVLTASDGQDTVSLPPFSITVDAVALGAATLSWTPPTTNTDGTPLSDLASYRIYWGTTLGDYPNSVVLDNPGLSSYTISNLVPGTYYFVCTAVDSTGDESAFSNVAQKTIQQAQ